MSLVHPKTAQIVDAFIQRRSFPSCLFLYGEDSPSCQHVADILVQACHTPATGSPHPHARLDHHMVAAEKSIRIDDIRRLQTTIRNGPVYNHVSTVIINAHHGMTVEAGNALLKLCEDPPPATHLFLLGCHQHQLLPTLRSRCQQLYCPATTPPSYLAAPPVAYADLHNHSFSQLLQALQTVLSEPPKRAQLLLTWLNDSLSHPKDAAIRHALINCLSHPQTALNMQVQIESILLLIKSHRKACYRD